MKGNLEYKDLNRDGIAGLANSGDDMEFGLHINQYNFGKETMSGAGKFRDSESNLFALGANYNSKGENDEYFYGFIYSFNLFFYVRTET